MIFWRCHYASVFDLIRQLTAVLEGEGGILWVLVLLALLVALLLRGGQL